MDAMTVEEMAKTERLEYFRQWRAANKDRIREHNANYWRKRAEKRLKEEGHHASTTNANH